MNQDFGDNIMRTTQFIGLSVNAIAYLHANVEKIVTYPEDWELHMMDDSLIDYNTSKLYETFFSKGYEAAIKRFCKTETFKTESLNIPVLGMFDEEVHILQRYYLKTGKYVDEYVQATVWSSGPVIFLALQDHNGIPIKESLWSDEDINNC